MARLVLSMEEGGQAGLADFRIGHDYSWLCGGSDRKNRTVTMGKAFSRME
jgi:hypothetical protein